MKCNCGANMASVGNADFYCPACRQGKAGSNTSTTSPSGAAFSDNSFSAKRKNTLRPPPPLIVLITGTVFVVVLLAIFVFTSINEWLNPSDEQITIPDFVGRRYDDIRFHDDYFDLYVFDVTLEANNDVAEGVVISQDPTAGRTRAHPRPGEKIRMRLWVSSGVS